MIEKEEVKINFTRTIKIPVYYETTKSKLNKLDKITAKLTYCTRLFSNIIKETKLLNRIELVKYENEIKIRTKLNSAYIQQCKDKAIWMWKSYNKQHKKWQYKLNKANNQKYYNKLLKREPSKPFEKSFNGKHNTKPFSKSNNKIPVRLDYRTISLKSNLKLKGNLASNLKNNKLSDLWINLTSLKKHDKIMIPLNPADYHLNKLKQANKISDCELIKKNNKWFIYVTCQYQISSQPIEKIRAIDLGISRSITTVLLEPGKNLNNNSFLVIKEGKKKQKLEYYDKLIAKLQEQEKWKVLKRTRQKRKNYIEDQERKIAEEITNISYNSILGIGYTKEIKYKNYKGNGNKQLRKKLHRWTYNRIINYIFQSCEEKGIKTIRLNEAYTSKTCSKCLSRNTERPYQNNWSLLKCNNCSYKQNADINATINQSRLIMRQVTILEKGLTENIKPPTKSSFNQLASDEHALTRNDNLQKGLSLETPN